MSELHEECGVVAVYHFKGKGTSPLCSHLGADRVSNLVPRMLLDVQNRGQLSAGITTYRDEQEEEDSCARSQEEKYSRPLLMTYKELGPVAEVFHQSHREQYEKLMERLAGNAAIGHVRYATCGRDDKNFAHPFERPHMRKNKWFSFAFNGQLANYEKLKEEIKRDHDVCFSRDSDSEIVMHYLCTAVKNAGRDLLEVCKKTTEKLDGAYSLVFLNACGEMMVVRDPHGFKPLCYAFDGSLFAAASESVALFNLGFSHDQIKDVPPGSVVIVTPDGNVRVETFMTSPRTTHCFFEWIYFANVASVLDGKSVYLARKRLGEVLAEQELEDENGVPLDADSIVVPVPDTSKAAADGMAYKLGIPCLEGLMRNRYSGRTFIEGGDSRRRKAETKYTPLPQVLEGKRIFLVEDSIVRSTTMRVLIERLRTVGHAKEIHVRVACPPIMAPCFYGIDMSTYSELFATRYMMKHYGLDGVFSEDDVSTRWILTREIEREMAEDLGCDSLRYLPPRALSTAIGIAPMNLCQACVNHEYPTEAGCELSRKALFNFANGNESSKRTYE